jgi:hypothetical protein
MKITINEHDFVDAFERSDNYKNNFSRAGLYALYDYLTELEKDIEEEFELDVIALCCDFVEYENFEKLQEDYDDINTKEDANDYFGAYIELDDGSIIVNQQ